MYEGGEVPEPHTRPEHAVTPGGTPNARPEHAVTPEGTPNPRPNAEPHPRPQTSHMENETSIEGAKEKARYPSFPDNPVGRRRQRRYNNQQRFTKANLEKVFQALEDSNATTLDHMLKTACWVWQATPSKRRKTPPRSGKCGRNISKTLLKA